MSENYSDLFSKTHILKNVRIRVLSELSVMIHITSLLYSNIGIQEKGYWSPHTVAIFEETPVNQSRTEFNGIVSFIPAHS